jgi:hypothetical protein
MLLVGTKVHGDTLPRNLAYAGFHGAGGISSNGQIVVGYVFGQRRGEQPEPARRRDPVGSIGQRFFGVT